MKKTTAIFLLVTAAFVTAPGGASALSGQWHFASENDETREPPTEEELAICAQYKPTEDMTPEQQIERTEVYNDCLYGRAPDPVTDDIIVPDPVPPGQPG